MRTPAISCSVSGRRTSAGIDRTAGIIKVATDVETLAALGNDTRYEALRLIATVDDEVCVCEIEPELGVSQGAVSQALSCLFSSGLVDRRKEGRWRYYATTQRADRLPRVLDETRISESD